MVGVTYKPPFRHFSMWQRLWLIVALMAWTHASCGEGVRVMSFNMLCGLCAPWSYGGWESREAGLTDTLRRAQPDLLAAQELTRLEHVHTVTRALPKLEVHVLDRGLPYYDSALFYDRERFEPLARGAFWLSDDPDARLGWGWVVSFPRAVVWLKLRDKRNGAAFYFVGTHMDNNRNNKRRSTALIRQRLAAFTDAPIILAGDFNVRPGTAFVQQLTAPTADDSRGFQESFDSAQRLEPVTDGPVQWEYGCIEDQPQSFPECRIDHIFLSGGTAWQVSRYSIDMYRYGERHQFISDHRAVWVDLDWRDTHSIATSANAH